MDRISKVVDFIPAIMVLLISNLLKTQQVPYGEAQLSFDWKPKSTTDYTQVTFINL